MRGLPTITGTGSVAKGGRSEIFLGALVCLIETLTALVVSFGGLLEVAIFVKKVEERKTGFVEVIFEEDEEFEDLRVS